MSVVYQRVRQPTILEITLALGLILILGGVLFWALNPVERVRRREDNQRLAGLERLRQAIDSATADGALLVNTAGIPVSSASVGATEAADGSGWIAMDLSGYLDSLSVDPANGEIFTDVLGNSVTGEYQFICDGGYYVLRTHLKAKINRDLYTEDGNKDSWYEVGTAPGLSTYFGL